MKSAEHSIPIMLCQFRLEADDRCALESSVAATRLMTAA